MTVNVEPGNMRVDLSKDNIHYEEVKREANESYEEVKR